MYRRFTKLLAILVFALMLLFPKQVFKGASDGLLLWFNSVLPTLLPFIILSNLLVKTRAIDWIARVSGPLLRHVFHVSGYGSFAVIAGFLCGYPMGSKVTADLLREGCISFQEAQYLLSFCNNASPIFIISYVAVQNLGQERLAVPVLAILLSSPALISFLARRTVFPCGGANAPHHAGRPEHRPLKAPSGTGKENSNILDACIMDGFEIITKVGGYIMLFSIFLSLAEMVPVSGLFYRYLLLPSLEITNGISLLCRSALPEAEKIFLCVICTSFGGWCAAAQTRCMVAGTGLSIKNYIIQKLAAALAASLLCFIYLQFLY